jgi:hypothetical protein
MNTTYIEKIAQITRETEALIKLIKTDALPGYQPVSTHQKQSFNTEPQSSVKFEPRHYQLQTGGSTIVRRLWHEIYASNAIRNEQRYAGSASVEDIAINAFEYSAAFHYVFKHNNCLALIQKLTLSNNSNEEREIALYIDLFPSLLIDKEHRGKAVKLINLAPNEHVELIDYTPEFNKQEWKKLTQEQRGSITVRVEDNESGKSLLVHSVSIDILCYDQWFFHYKALSPAFINPDHKYLFEIAQDIARKLGCATGSTSLPGYQKDVTYQLQMVSVMFEYLRDSGLIYHNPKMAYNGMGQRVRMIPEIIRSRSGTCLDLAFFQCSIVEKFGLNPFIVFIEGHAFYGVWMHENMRFPQFHYTYEQHNAEQFITLIENQSIVLMNSTEITDKNCSFEDTQRNALTYIDAVFRANKTVELVDVRGAREMGINYLP